MIKALVCTRKQNPKGFTTGQNSKMTSSCKWPITLAVKLQRRKCRPTIAAAVMLVLQGQLCHLSVAYLVC